MSLSFLLRTVFSRGDLRCKHWAQADRIAECIHSSPDADSMLATAAGELARALNLARCSVVLFAEDGTRLTAAHNASDLPAHITGKLDLADTTIGRNLYSQATVSEIAAPDAKIAGFSGLAGASAIKSVSISPVILNARAIGGIIAYSSRGPRWSRTETQLVEAIATRLSLAIHHLRSQEEAKRAADREMLIRKISSAIYNSPDTDAVLQAIVDELGAALSACRCRLALLPDPLPDHVFITHSYTNACCINLPHLELVLVVNNALLQMALQTNEPVAIDDVSSDERISKDREQYVASGVKSLLVSAIWLGGRPIGFLSLHYCEQPHAWAEWEIDVVRSVAEQAAVAIRQAGLFREARESATRAALVNHIVAAIRRSLDLKQTIQVAVEELGRALGANRTQFRKVDGDEVVVVAEYITDSSLSLSHVSASVDGYIATHLIQTRKTLIIDDVRSFMAAHPDRAATVRSWQVEPISLSEILCPIFVNDQFWGALSIGQTDRPRKWTASEISLVEAITAQIEVAVSHSNLFEETRKTAQVEALVSHIVHGINQSNQLDEIFPIVARELGKHLNTDSLLIVRLSEDTGQWKTECAYSNGEVTKPTRPHRTEEIESLEALMENDLVLCDDAENDPRFDQLMGRFLRPVGTRAFMAVRLLYNDAPCLAIVAIMRSGPRKWTGDEVEVIRSAANQVSIALQRAELFQQVSLGKYEWESTFDALTDGLLIFDQNGLLRRVNQAGAAFEGAHARDLIGRRCCTLLQGIESDHCRVAQVIKTGRPVTFELVPERLKRPVLVTMAPLTNYHSDPVKEDSTGDKDSPPASPAGALGAVCIVRDLSELRAAEAVAREQRSFLVKLIEHASDSIFAISPEGKLIWFNERLSTFSGYSREEMIENGVWQFLRSDEKKMAIERFTRALSGQPQTFEMHGIQKSGEVRLLLITFTPIYDEGRVTSVLSIARDITEERMASERAAQADKLHALGQLASGVAHNFNNILAAILGHAQLIKRYCKDELIRERIDIIECAALDGAQTVKRIQGFGSQQEVAVAEAIDINHLIQDSTSLTRARWSDDAQARGLHYEVEMDLQEVPVLHGSASELREVFVNIIFNALDAMPQGGRLRITTEAKGSLVRASFTDNGIGMTREVREHIFEPFFTTKGASGTGLGLAVSYSIVERHGGRIEINSNPGQGTTFTITLPAGPQARRKASRLRTAKVEAANILVIDDDERVREAMAGMLKSAGHHTEQAASGREALAKLEHERFELVFTDLSMPEMDGWAVANEIRRCWPSVKIVLMTGHAVSPETVRLHRELVNEVLYKPIRFDDISITLGQVLS